MSAAGSTNMAAAPTWSHNGTVYFCNDADQRLYRQQPGAVPTPITPEPGRPRGLRYADGVMDAARGRMIWVREDHTTGAREPVNTLVEMPLDASRPQRVLQVGPRFLRGAAPQPRRRATRLARMEPSADAVDRLRVMGRRDRRRTARSAANAGSPAAMTSRSFSRSGRPTAALYFVSDRAQQGIAGRWWNLFRVRGRGARRRLGDRAGLAVGRRVRPAAVEFPHVDLCLRVGATRSSAAISKTACIGWGRSISARCRRARSRPPTRTFPRVRAAGGRVYFRGGSPSEPPAIVELDLASGRTTVLRRSTTQDVEAYRGYLSAPEPVTLRHR